LQPWATPLADTAVLAVPLTLPRDEAMAFCRWQGGRLVCPSTLDYHQRLQRYLCQRIDTADMLEYHLGLVLSAPGEASWQSGAPLDWTAGPRRFLAHLAATGHAAFAFVGGDGSWQAVAPTTACYLLIEWDR
jgi:hypothetical protein